MRTFEKSAINGMVAVATGQDRHPQEAGGKVSVWFAQQQFDKSVWGCGSVGKREDAGLVSAATSKSPAIVRVFLTTET
jgi:hypothetical protein